MRADRLAPTLAAAALLFTALVATGTPDDAPVTADGRAIAPVAPELLHIAVDKPLYRPGEAIWFRAWELEAASLRSIDRERGVTFELVDPRGAAIQEKRVRVVGGVASNDFILDGDIAGGRYTLRATSDGGASAERSVVVARYELPRFEKTVTLDRRSYAPGDAVALAIALRGADDEPLARALVTATAWVDGAQVARVAGRSDRRGETALRFSLPARIARGDALVTISVDHGGVTEVLQRRVPIVLDEVVLGAYPEGGDLVAGLPSRLFVRARTPLGEPVVASLELVDDDGTRVGSVATGPRGMGHVAITPEAGRRYRLQVAGDDRARGEVLVADALAAGCVLRTGDDGGRALAIEVACTGPERVTAVARLRGREIARTAIDASEAGQRATLEVPPAVRGVVVVTIYRASGEPACERLVYRGLEAGVRVELSADRDRYAPRDQVTLTVRAHDAAGEPLPGADLAVAVVDRAVFELAGKPDGTILSRLHLEPELPGQRIDDAAFYFSDAPGAAEALDHLLATAGWRRFRQVRR